ncbi:heme-degrading monooxygenase HmoA [Deinobacterium chartae]|uniref:Heme-degrading monooxygenase HmoA n=2 Tax=Deinobacterium chartae TaxID=521158 RepID=A0A841HW73_9DEIO|nr:antibiotic biosynthesis monooxygenase [Deinobacterium chartae]MBB6096904.1 heme-degrading monooxygenase HmoA [Deinobacterium chartae]
MNRLFVNPEFHAAFEENFRHRAGAVDGMPGFVRNQVLRPAQEGQPYVVVTTWESREHFEGWVNSDAFRQGHARSGSLPREAFSAPSSLETFEVLLDTQG